MNLMDLVKVATDLYQKVVAGDWMAVLKDVADLLDAVVTLLKTVSN